VNPWPSVIALLTGSVLGAGITAYAVRDSMSRIVKEETSVAVEKVDKRWEATLFGMAEEIEKNAAEDCKEQLYLARGEMDAALEKYKKEQKHSVVVERGDYVAVFCPDGYEPVQVGWSKGTGLRVRCYDATLQGKPWGEKQ
jgi:hypothetical protein